MKKLVCAAMSAALTISLASLTNFSYLCYYYSGSANAWEHFKFIDGLALITIYVIIPSTASILILEWRKNTKLVYYVAGGIISLLWLLISIYMYFEIFWPFLKSLTEQRESHDFVRISSNPVTGISLGSTFKSLAIYGSIMCGIYS